MIRTAERNRNRCAKVQIPVACETDIVDKVRPDRISVAYRSFLVPLVVGEAAQFQEVFLVPRDWLAVYCEEISYKHRLFGTVVVVDAADGLFIGQILRMRYENLPARYLRRCTCSECRWNIFQDCLCQRIDCPWSATVVPDVVCEEIFSQDCLRGNAAGRSVCNKRGEVAAQFGLCRHVCGRTRGVRLENCPLISGEEKQLVFLYRPADNAAKLVPLQAVSSGGVGSAGVEEIVANILKRVAVKRIRAVLGDDVYSSRRILSIPRTQGACLYVEFLDGIRKWQRRIQVIARIVVDTAIHYELHGVALAAGDCVRYDRVFHIRAARSIVLVGIQITHAS